MATSAGQQPVTWVPWREPWAWPGSAGSINLIAMHRALRYLQNECQAWQARERGGKGTKHGQNDRKATQRGFFHKGCASVPQDGSLQGSAGTSGKRDVLGWGSLGRVGVWVLRVGGGGFQFPNLPAHVGDPPPPMWVTQQPPPILPDNVRKGWRKRGLCCTPAASPCHGGEGADSPVAPKSGEAPWGGLRGL